MMEAASKMMQNMKPEDMAKMSEFASKMDPKTMENMMSNMGGAPPGMDAKQMSEQMKNMSPEQMRAQMNQAQQQMGAQKTYYMNAAHMLKNEGNQHYKNEKYTEALEVYNRAIENLRPHAGDDVRQMRTQLLSNAALCYLKQKCWGKARDSCDEALKIDPKNIKATLRRGQALAGLDNLSEAWAELKLAVSLSPEDKSIKDELTRVQKQCKERSVAEPPAATRGGGASASTSTASTPTSFSPGSSASASSSSGTRDMSEAVDALSKNPEMLEQATQAMKNMSPEDLQKMMQNAPMPPGMDADMMKSKMEALSANPDMIKNAVETLKALPEEERKKLLSKEGAGGPNMGSMESMSKVLENPEMMKQVAEMAKNVNPEDVGGDPEQAEMMRKAAEQLQSNPELGKQMSDMMKNMDPEQLQKMMELSQSMRGSRKEQSSSSDSSSPMGGLGASGDAYEAMMSDPKMMKAAEEMMKSMSPETLASMARSSGIDIDENKAKMLGKLMPFIPWVMKAMRAFGYVRKGWKALWTPRGKVICALVVLSIGILQHYRSG